MPSVVKTAALTTFALVAFAGNSVLCRLALGGDSIDAASFSSIRLLSGILMLALILALSRPKGKKRSTGSWSASFMLFLYATTFSFAYVSLDTGIGALILFGAVQITMIMISLIKGTRLHVSEWLGVILAFSGFIYLVMPGLTAPSLTGFLLMATAGIAWGIYTVKGQASQNPVSDTTYNFLRTLPLVLILVMVTFPHARLSNAGILLAVLSGAVTSGIGYAVWYMALRDLSISKAAVVQLCVPIIAAAGGILFAHETIPQRMLLASVMILGGILMVIMRKHFTR
ncbi:MAG: DMT family transporter [Emcibacter sp.]|nr:DMT family transporter [Emcibacter sp.]